jgi:membrane protein
MSTKKIRKLSWLEVWELTKLSFKTFFKGDSFTHGAALAYYAIFALVPIIYLALSSFGQVVGQERIIEIVGYLLETNMGIEEIGPITDLMVQWDIGTGGSFALRTVGVVVLIFTSTALFNSLRNSLNSFFSIQPIHHYNVVLENLLSRLISFGMLALFGLIIILVYFGQTILMAVSGQIFSEATYVQRIALFIIEHLSIILVNFLLFTIVFKYLHDGYLKWKLAFGGSLFTAILLYLGQLLINYYLTNFFFAANSGIAGTLLAILTWIFYTSQIIFLGATFTASYAKFVGKPIVPKK